MQYYRRQYYCGLLLLMPCLRVLPWQHLMQHVMQHVCACAGWSVTGGWPCLRQQLTTGNDFHSALAGCVVLCCLYHAVLPVSCYSTGASSSGQTWQEASAAGLACGPTADSARVMIWLRWLPQTDACMPASSDLSVLAAGQCLLALPSLSRHEYGARMSTSHFRRLDTASSATETGASR